MRLNVCLLLVWQYCYNCSYEIRILVAVRRPRHSQSQSQVDAPHLFCSNHFTWRQIPFFFRNTANLLWFYMILFHNISALPRLTATRINLENNGKDWFPFFCFVAESDNWIIGPLFIQHPAPLCPTFYALILESNKNVLYSFGEQVFKSIAVILIQYKLSVSRLPNWNVNCIEWPNNLLKEKQFIWEPPKERICWN